MPGIQDMNVQMVAVGCLHILTGNAIPSFPGSTRSHPSLYAFVNLTVAGALLPKWKPYFPMTVPWDLWNEYAVPVLQYLKRCGWNTNVSWDVQVATIQALIEGLLGSVSKPPVVVPETPTTPDPDPGISWPDGTPRFVYPIVD